MEHFFQRACGADAEKAGGATRHGPWLRRSQALGCTKGEQRAYYCYYFRGSLSKMKLKVVLEPNDKRSYMAIVPALPGCISENETQEDAFASIHEAIELYLEPVEDDPHFPPDAELLEITI
jgi:predicted RNase H-like HicB family nuclease